jgi:membrane associated rhomboid family serine protease
LCASAVVCAVCWLADVDGSLPAATSWREGIRLGPLAVRLIAHPFYHVSPAHLLTNCAWLAALGALAHTADAGNAWDMDVPTVAAAQAAAVAAHAVFRLDPTPATALAGLSPTVFAWLAVAAAGAQRAPRGSWHRAQWLLAVAIVSLLAADEGRALAPHLAGVAVGVWRGIRMRPVGPQPGGE